MKTVTKNTGAKTYLQGLGAFLLLAGALACGRLSPDFLLSSAPNSSSKVSTEGKSDKEVEVGVSLEQQATGFGLTSSDLAVISFNISVDGCSAAHSYYNKNHLGIVFAGTSTLEKIALPSDDAACVMHLTQIKINALGTAPSVTHTYDVIDSAEIASDRDSGGQLVLSQSVSAAGAPSHLVVAVSQFNWPDSPGLPLNQAKISYQLQSVVAADSVRGKVVGALGFDPPSMPVEIYLAGLDSETTPTKIAGLRLMCTASLGGGSSCGDLDGNVSSASNFKVCIVKGSITQNFLEENLLSICNATSVSAVNQSAAQTLATPADFAVDTSITSSAFSGGIPMYPSTGGAPLDINFSTTAANGDYITAVSILSDSPDSYLVIYVKNGTKEGWKYWKLDF